jgi:hypothetical protein
MQSLTVKKFLESPIVELEPHTYIYVFRDGDTILYVGQSISIIDRISSHLGESWHASPSQIGELVQSNHPESLSWLIELYTLDDCTEAVSQTPYVSFYGSPRCTIEGRIDMAERAMIGKYHPCLNVQYNQDATPLPTKYTHVRPNDSSSLHLNI